VQRLRSGRALGDRRLVEHRKQERRGHRLRPSRTAERGAKAPIPSDREDD
jgi:hypothetical protein